MIPPGCPVCGKDCISDAEVLIKEAMGRFSPCEECLAIPLDKRLPPPGLPPAEQCPVCRKRFIDDVFSHCHLIMAEGGVIDAETPLGAIGTPLISPGTNMSAPPFLPERSLVLLTRNVDRKTAERLVAEVPEIKGVIGDKGAVPGISGGDFSLTSENELLAGCDVRADIFRTSGGAFAVYKQQSLMHIEFPRGTGPKIQAVESMILKEKPDVFIDACSGAGTLGLVAIITGVPVVVLNDAWYPASFWSAINLYANRGILKLDEVEIFAPPGDPGRRISPDSVRIAESSGNNREALVLWGDYMNSGNNIPKGRRLATIDIFGKDNAAKLKKIISDWKAAYGGDAFIP
ncbi:MAG: hypothetical protein JW931_07845 [Methanomicrobiaceae archaeon]|nr:hypothetical protein [Methanomicrobiaceae archaeon]